MRIWHFQRLQQKSWKSEGICHSIYLCAMSSLFGSPIFFDKHTGCVQIVCAQVMQLYLFVAAIHLLVEINKPIRLLHFHVIIFLVCGSTALFNGDMHCVCVFVCVLCVCVRVCVLVHMCVWVCICMRMSLCVHIQACLCFCVFRNTCKLVCRHVWVWVNKAVILIMYMSICFHFYLLFASHYFHDHSPNRQTKEMK